MKQLLAAASVCALMIAAPAWAQNSGAQTTTGGQTLSQQDRTFVEKAGSGSLEKQISVTSRYRRARRPAVREFGRWMYTDHGLVANNWLKTIMAAQGENFQPTLTAQDKEMRRKLDTLSGRRFDQEYIQAQVADHEKTIPIFETEAKQGQNTMIKNFAQNMVPVLQQHLAEAKALAGGGATTERERSSATERSGSSSER